MPINEDMTVSAGLGQTRNSSCHHHAPIEDCHHGYAASASHKANSVSVGNASQFKYTQS
jgi:hypothetical protein